MPPKPKKGKKNKGSKGPPEKEYVLLTLDDMKAREQKYSNRLSDLRICLKFIDDAILQVGELNEAQLNADKWQDFITCNPLPKPYIPPDVRLFFEKLKYLQEKSIEANIDWLLATDECSILTQDIFSEDLTRLRLKDKLKPEFGYEYNKYINDSLNIIRRIEYFLENNVEVAKCSNSMLTDIQKLKKSVQDHISDFFDRYTYRILCSEEAYMISVDAKSSEYCFSADSFQMHLWTLKSVPIRFSHLEEPRLIANFHEINLRLHIPSTMLRENLSIRAIRMKFDHVSENAKSYFQPITLAVDNLNAGIQDLHECLINEWFMQMDLQSRLRNEMVQKRLEYEERMRQFEEEEAKKGKKQRGADDKEGKKVMKPKLVRPSKEPPTVGPDMFPDIYPDFLEEEQKQYEYFINTIYNPESLDLDQDEINLKRFCILGGVYQLQYVEKPEHYDCDVDRFNMTWHRNDAKLKVHHDIYIPSTPRYLSRRTTRLMSQMSLRRLTRFTSALDPPKDSTDPECPWFVLTFTLPEYLCYWGEPIACHYETITKFLVEPITEPPPVLEVSKKSKGSKKAISNTSLATTQPTLPTSENDVIQTKDSEYYPFLTPYAGEAKTSILKLRRLSVSSRLSKGNFFRSSLTLRMSHGDIARQARDSDGTLNVHDFLLSRLLNKAQIRHLERHCIPRIISSFKFPKEVLEEELEAYRNKPKGKGGTLLRKQTTVGDEVGKKSPNRAFAFNDQQTNPERLFAVYESEEPIRIIHQLLEDETTTDFPMEPETFLELIRILNHIKEKYRLRVRQTLDLKPFKSKVKLENKRLKQLAKKLERKPISASIIAEKNVAPSKVERRTTFRDKPEDVKSPMIVKVQEDIKPKDENKVEIVDPSKLQLITHATSAESQYREKIGEKETESTTYTHWTTKHILHSEYNKKKHTMVIRTDRLGYIGFAFKRYEHFPFKYWNLEPSETDPDNEVVFTLETQYVRCVLYCTPDGIRGYVTEPSKKFVRNPKMYLIIENPMKDYKEFKKIFKDNYLNIFADHDACYYIENGYFSEKHLATEMHTYCCMAVHSTQMKFSFSQWNRLAKRRDLILKFVQFKDLPENLVEVRITPEEAFFVEITELCSDDLEVIKLHYTPTWRNIGTYTDFHHLISSMYPAATDMRCKNPKLISCIRDLLNEIRPLSFS